MISLGLRFQYNRAKKKGLINLLVAAARQQSLPPEFVLAVASRETGIQNILGDHGHGHGVIQIDDRYHSDVLSRNKDWKTNPKGLIEYGVKMLADNRGWAIMKWPTFTETQHLKIAAAAYNAGRGGAYKGVLDGNTDLHTAGKNYGADVLKRMQTFAKILKN